MGDQYTDLAHGKYYELEVNKVSFKGVAIVFSTRYLSQLTTLGLKAHRIVVVHLRLLDLHTLQEKVHTVAFESESVSAS